MTERRYATPRGVVDTVESVIGRDNGIDEGSITVIDAGRSHVVGDTREELDRRNVTGEYICTIEFERVRVGEHVTTTLELRFHERVVDRGSFELRPAGPKAISPDQATGPLELSSRIDDALSEFVEEYDPTFWFAGVEAQSMASGGHYTDFEFEYSIDAVSL